MARKGSDPLVLLDACCLINLLATGRAEEVLSVLPYQFATSRLVALEEVLSIAEAGELTGFPVRVDQLENLTLIDVTSDEETADFVRFSTLLDAGEASLCALAIHRSAVVATDDRKALRALLREKPQVSTLQTPDLLYEWACCTKPSEREIAEALRAVRSRARFYPRRDTPRFEWWAGFFR
jgi:predicted nucleic acid-binding protein